MAEFSLADLGQRSPPESGFSLSDLTSSILRNQQIQQMILQGGAPAEQVAQRNRPIPAPAPPAVPMPRPDPRGWSERALAPQWQTPGNTPSSGGFSRDVIPPDVMLNLLGIEPTQKSIDANAYYRINPQQNQIPFEQWLENARIYEKKT